MVPGMRWLLTDRRFILAESGTGTIREDLPFTAIALAVPDFNTLREPVIMLTLLESDGTRRQLELIFVHVIGDLNIQDRDRCLSRPPGPERYRRGLTQSGQTSLTGAEG